MPSSRRLIASNTLTSSAADVTFSSIPGTYTDLILRISGRTNNGSVQDSIRMTINGVGGTSYSRTQIYGNGATAASTNNSLNSVFQTSLIGLAGSSATANTFGSIELYIPSYTVSQNKPLGFFGAGENNATTAYVGTAAGLWTNTAAITTLAISMLNGTTFDSGSSFFLYGISNT